MAKILIVDDEPRIRELIEEHLEHEGYQCTQASDGAAALAAVAAGGIDLVILDVMMPFMDGMTCLKEMRLRGMDVPVIILTARGEEYDKLEGLGAGADDYVVKPFSPRELVARVRAVLARTMRRDGQGAESFVFGGLAIDTASHTVTIDGEDAKDLDDAISVSKENGVYTLGVHIADVSHYVTENSPLDEEALKRGTSVYLVDRVIPMLPHKLSNGICSLNAGTDRLALSCIMEVDAQGTVLDHRIAGTVIHVDRRMTYTAVNAVVTDRDEAVMAEYEEFVPMFDCMKELADILRENRRKRGAIDFDFPESKIVLNEQGKPLEIKPYERNAATRIIEDFMLLANETVAEDYYWQSIPFLFRSHDNPDPEKMKQLGTFINNFGYFIKMQHGEIHPKELQKLLDKIEGTPEEALLSRLTLRSMKQAKYTTLCSGHFGLATRYYTHFTSPIRRYPDLQIHRIIKETLKGGLSDKRAAHYEKILPEVAVQTSALERRADEAERETDKLKKCEYMSRFIGQDFDGAISGVTNWGLYVELPNTVEGLVRMSDLDDDYYIFDEQHYELIGEMTKKTYKLGQPVRVTVSSTDRLLRTVDFILAKDWEKHPVEEKGE